MPEYYQVLKTAIDALERSDEAEQRRNIYSEARNTLIAELRAVSPPLNPADISRRRLELEETIRKVERELASNTTLTPLLHDVPSVSEGTRTALPPEMANAPPDTAPEDVFRRAIQAAKNYGILNGSAAAVLAKHEPARTPEQDGAATTAREWLPAGDEARPANPRLLAPTETDDLNHADRTAGASASDRLKPLSSSEYHYLNEEEAVLLKGRVQRSHVRVLLLRALIIAVLLVVIAFAWSHWTMIVRMIAALDGKRAASTERLIAPAVSAPRAPADSAIPAAGDLRSIGPPSR